MESKVITILVKRGHNVEMVKNMVAENLSAAVKAYPEAKPSFIANVVATL
jgi:hypothetical protein